jgi:HK97 family phage major capsid protein
MAILAAFMVPHPPMIVPAVGRGSEQQIQKTIDAYKLTDLIKVSIELLDDSAFDLESYIANEFAYAFGAAEEEA